MCPHVHETSHARTHVERVYSCVAARAITCEAARVATLASAHMQERAILTACAAVAVRVSHRAFNFEKR